jgi:capsular polysaccharide biosynthesis protein
LGCDIVDPQELSALDQIRTFSSADLVIGPSGSGMFNAVFCNPGTRLVDIESEPHWIQHHMCLFGSSGLSYGVFEGSTIAKGPGLAHHQPFTVNIDALVDRVASLIPKSG